jgi:hypothetical protein
MIKSKQNEVKQACALCFWCKARWPFNMFLGQVWSHKKQFCVCEIEFNIENFQSNKEEKLHSSIATQNRHIDDRPQEFPSLIYHILFKLVMVMCIVN